jgi:hypothetical protein
MRHSCPGEGDSASPNAYQLILPPPPLASILGYEHDVTP